MLEEKEKKEKELRMQILEEAEVFIRDFYEKRKLNVDSNKTINREKEKVRIIMNRFMLYLLMFQNRPLNCV